MQINNFDFLNSSLSDDNIFNDLNNIIQWIKNLREETGFIVEKKSIFKLKDWCIKKNNDEIYHSKNIFFSINGLKTFSSFQDLDRNEQPIIFQEEIGYLGFIVKKFDGILYFLVQAKIEPGNIDGIQLSPTLQATVSNYNKQHGGREPYYLNYFLKVSKNNILFDNLQSEQGSRFFKKRNRNIIINVEEDITLEKNFKWMTLKQLKLLMQKDNIVNMDTRSVISLINYSNLTREEKTYKNYQKFINLVTNGSIFLKSFSGIYKSKICLEEIIRILIEKKSSNYIKSEIVGLSKIKGWEFNSYELVNDLKDDFRVIGINASIGSREIFCWDQPIIEPLNIGLLGLIGKIINNNLHVIVSLKPEIGTFDVIEFGPTVQLKNQVNKSKDPYHEFILESKNKKIIFDTLQSEEGGRFYQEQNRNIFVLANDDFSEELLPDYVWIDLYQLSFLNQFNNMLNIQLRNLLALLPNHIQK